METCGVRWYLSSGSIISLKKVISGGRKSVKSMWFSIAAEVIVILHLGFIIFVVMGALLVLKWRWVIFAHIPAALWGALIEFQGWRCPLTPLEISLRAAAGQAGYPEGFIDHYLLPIIYPGSLTRELQITFGFIIIVINLAIYGWVIVRRRKLG